MSYPGNSSLSKEIQTRILTTFEQTLTLAGEGSRQEALLGCDFILRLDPYFAFAQTLQERLEESEKAIEVEDLRQSLAAATETRTEAPAKPVQPEPAPVAPPPGGVDLDSLFAEPEAPAALGSPPPAPVEAPAPAAEEVAAEEVVDETLTASELLDEATEEMGGEDESVAHDAGTQKRISDLLAEGQVAFDEAQYQTAIDSWSRIFLIDIDHAEANRRIEQARKLKAEVERQVEEIFHEGLTELEAGKLSEARSAFQRVLDKQSNHLAAREYLLKIDSGALAPPSPGPHTAATEPGDDLLDIPDEALTGATRALPDLPGEGSFAAPPLSEEPLSDMPGSPPPAPAADDETAEAPPTEWARAAQAGAAPQRKAFKLIAAGVLLVVVVLGWLLYSKWPKLFPNSAATEAIASRPEIDPIRRALALHEEGQTPIAIAQLRRLPPDHQKHAEAQALIAQWETAGQAGQEVEGPSEVEVEKFLSLVALARRAADSGDNLGAQALLQEAQAIVALADDHRTLHETVEQRLAVVNKELDLFRQGDWEYALRTLWFLREELPENNDVRRLIVDSYHNLGVRDLQRGNPKEAGQKFAEALVLAPQDPQLQRLSSFAITYRDRPADLLYQIYVKYLPFR